MDEKKYTIDNISELTGFPRRTIRFYVEMGLITPPAGRGRGGYYDEGHLCRLLKIKELRDKGVPIQSMKVYLEEEVNVELHNSHSNEEQQNKRTVFVSYAISDGVTLCLSRDIENKYPKKVNSALKILKEIFEEEGHVISK